MTEIPPCPHCNEYGGFVSKAEAHGRAEIYYDESGGEVDRVVIGELSFRWGKWKVARCAVCRQPRHDVTFSDGEIVAEPFAGDDGDRGKVSLINMGGRRLKRLRLAGGRVFHYWPTDQYLHYPNQPRALCGYVAKHGVPTGLSWQSYDQPTCPRCVKKLRKLNEKE